MDPELAAGFDQLAAQMREISDAAERRWNQRFDEHTAAMEQRFKEHTEAEDQRFNELATIIAKSFEATEARWNERFDRLEHRVDTLDNRTAERFDRLEKRVEGMDVKFTEKFISIDESFRTLHLRIEHFEKRTLQTTVEIRDDVATLSRRVNSLDSRVGGLEDSMVQLNERVDRLGDDMRQRFKVVND